MSQPSVELLEWGLKDAMHLLHELHPCDRDSDRTITYGVEAYYAFETASRGFVLKRLGLPERRNGTLTYI
jgi:hypothetical protein